MQAVSVQEALNDVESASFLQPLLLKVGGKHYIKVDKIAIPVECPSLIEAVDLLFQVFYVFGLEYPWYLRAVYGFFEDVCGMPNTVKNFTAICSFKKSLNI